MIDTKKRLIIEAIKLFEKTACELISNLAQEHDLDLTRNNPFSKLLSRQNNLWKGALKNNWSYWFHGDACQFENSVTHQLVDVKINRNGNYGVISNFYLFRFIETTESLKETREMIGSFEAFNALVADLEKNKVIIDIGELLQTRVLNYTLLKNIN